MRFSSRAVLISGTLALLLGGVGRAQAAPGPGWGAIASMNGWYGYSFNQPSRSGAELAALAQCDRAAGRAGTCVVRTSFDHACGALATGNYGEWGAATAATDADARKAAASQCDSHLPAEPCKQVVNVCSSN